VPYTPGTKPGDWRPTPPGFLPPVLPNWPLVTPFALKAASQFRPGRPPALTSSAYARSFNQVKSIGAANSTTRTPEQTEIARFWLDGSGTSTPVGHWNRIAEDVAIARGNTLAQNARLFALLNIAEADVGIAAWKAKYTYNFWRPITAIREAATDGNRRTVADPGWTPLVVTPNHPSYPSGHADFSGAAARVLADFFGTDRVAFTSRSEAPLDVTRSYTRFSQAAKEAAMSRVYAGIHWSFDVEDGLRLGQRVGRYVSRNVLIPLRPHAAAHGTGRVR
ncbi:MAG: vanadium-dependent haloperoxidase, partial [Isosphaeraceae bacterium]|nr:vanadium-dependent haloperoxidase [Isosphaeraceae bacterium]